MEHPLMGRFLLVNRPSKKFEHQQLLEAFGWEGHRGRVFTLIIIQQSLYEVH